MSVADSSAHECYTRSKRYIKSPPKMLTEEYYYNKWTEPDNCRLSDECTIEGWNVFNNQSKAFCPGELKNEPLLSSFLILQDKNYCFNLQMLYQWRKKCFRAALDRSDSVWRPDIDHLPLWNFRNHFSSFAISWNNKYFSICLYIRAANGWDKIEMWGFRDRLIQATRLYPAASTVKVP